MTSPTSRTSNAATIAQTYFTAWQNHDFDTLRCLLDDAVTFRGPLGTATDAEQCLRGLRGMTQILTGIEIRRVFVDDADVLSWFDLHTCVAPPVPCANWSRIRNGRITEIHVAFDARAIATALGR